MGGQLLADPAAEARQPISPATEQGLVMRALGGAAVFPQSAGGQPRLDRFVKDLHQMGAKVRWHAEPEREHPDGW